MGMTVLLTAIAIGIGIRLVSEKMSRAEECFWRRKSLDYHAYVHRQSLARSLDESTRRRPPLTRGENWKGWRSAVVRDIKDESPTCRSFGLELADGDPLPKFSGGQSILVSLRHPVDGKPVSRRYSLSGSVADPRYQITVKRVPGGALSNLLHDTVKVGDEIRIQAPRGQFVCTPQENAPLHLIAAGIGITPMLAMALECIHAKSIRPIRLYYQLRNSDDAPFLEFVRELAGQFHREIDFKLHVWWSRPLDGDVGPDDRTGRLDAKMVVQQSGETDGRFMICGPERFMSSIATGLINAGVSETHVKYESFGRQPKGPGAISVEGETSAAPAETNRVRREIQFEPGETKAIWDGEHDTLLEFAESLDLEVDSACREGECGACVLRLARGSVDYVTEPTCEHDGGDVVLCVARPKTDLRIELASGQ